MNSICVRITTDGKFVITGYFTAFGILKSEIKVADTVDELLRKVKGWAEKTDQPLVENNWDK